MIDVNEVVALVGATEKPQTSLVQEEMKQHANIRVLERPTPNTEEILDTPKHEHLVVDTDCWVMDDYVELMELQENKNLKEVLAGQRKFCMRVVKDWNF